MSQHTGDVLARTILIPGMLLGALAFGGSYALKKFNTTDAARKQRFQEHTQRVNEVDIATTALKPYGPKLREWKSAASSDTRATMDKTIRDLKGELDNTKIVVTETKDDVTSPLGAEKKLAAGMTMRSYKQRWEGTFRQLGKLLIRIEERNPTLHLTELTLSPSNSGMLQSPALGMDVTWGAWEGNFKINQTYGEDKVIDTNADNKEQPSPPTSNAQ